LTIQAIALAVVLGLRLATSPAAPSRNGLEPQPLRPR
jgi:hypothetical protein